MGESFNNYLVELTSDDPARLRDAEGLSSLVVAAAGAIGVAALGPPIVRESNEGVGVALLCREGYIVVHSVPAEGICLVDIVARAPTDVAKGAEVISRRLAGS